MSKKQTVKYNATEVHITHSVVALFLYIALFASVWAVRHFYGQLRPFNAVYVTAPLFTLAAGWFHFARKKHPGEPKLWSNDFWSCVLTSGAIAHLLLLCSLPVDIWEYTAPIAYVMLAVHYLLFVTTHGQGKNFSVFARLCATAGMGVIATFETYYNRYQNSYPTRLFSQATAFAVGWCIIAGTAIAIWYIGRRTKASVWKQESVAVIFALFWGALQIEHRFELNYGELTCIIFGGILLVWYLLLRVLRQSKVIR